MKKTKISKNVFKKIVKLSKLSVDKKELAYFTEQFNQTLKIVNKLNSLETKSVIETDQVTGKKNVTREDKIDKKRMLTQKQALSQAKKTYKGYFLVKSVFLEEYDA